MIYREHVCFQKLKILQSTLGVNEDKAVVVSILANLPFLLKGKEPMMTHCEAFQQQQINNV